MQQSDSILDRLWLWGMKVNALQEIADYAKLGFSSSTLTTEQAIKQTGICNVFMAGGLEIDEQTLASMPSARRIVCKWTLHDSSDGKNHLDYAGAESRLIAAKCLAAQDRRVEAFLLDDFSTGSMDAGALSDHLAQLQYINATIRPQLPLFGTIYVQSLTRAGLADMLRHFDQIVLPLWHVDRIDTLPEAVERCAELSGNKPMLVCIYPYDFGDGKMLTADQMQHQLDVVEPLVRSQRITGLLFCGTCIMDLGWDSVECLCNWISKVGGKSRFD